MRGVKNGPSPEWMQRRLKAIGLRPINALVDITNYITFDRGRPLHVFDAAEGEGRPHRAPRARGRGGRSRSTARPTRSTTDIVVIADDNGVESIAGIMGGEHSGCDENTTDVLIESALWDPLQHRADRAASSASTPMRAIASSAASIPPSACPASISRPTW